MNGLTRRKTPGLMLALDVPSLEEAQSLCEEVIDVIDAVKIGSLLLTSPRGGLRVIGKISALGVPVLVDTKILDAPHVVIETVKNYVQHGAKNITMYANVGNEVFKQCISEFPDLNVFLLTGMTFREESKATIQVRSALELASASGVTNLQVPGNYPALVQLIRQEMGNEACIVACGMGVQGGKPGSAWGAGANYEIVGRQIINAWDPKSEAISWKSHASI